MASIARRAVCGMGNPITFGFAAVGGRILVFVGVKRAQPMPVADFTGAGYTDLGDYTNPSGVGIFAKVAAGGETGIAQPSGTFPKNGVIYELDGYDWLSRLGVAGPNGGPSLNVVGPAITPPAGRGAVILGVVGAIGDAVNDMTAVAPWTLDGTSNGDVNQPHFAALSREVAAAAGAYAPAVTEGNNTTWSAVTASFSAPAVGSFTGEPGGGVW